MKKLLGILVLGLFFYTNVFAGICNTNYKPNHPKTPDSDDLLTRYPFLKPYKPTCIWNSTPCTQIEYDTYVAQVNAYNMMLNEFGVYYNQYVEDLKKYLNDVNDYASCDMKYINQQIEFKKNLP